MYGKLRLAEYCFIKGNQNTTVLMELIYFDLLHRNILLQTKEIAVYKSKKSYHSFIKVANKEKLNLFERKFVSVNNEKISLKEFISILYLLDNSEPSSQLLFNKKITYYIKKEIENKGLIKNFGLFWCYNKKGRIVRKRISKELLFNKIDYSLIVYLYKKYLDEEFSISGEKFLQFLKEFESEYNSCKIRSGYPMAALGNEYPILENTNC